RGRLARRAAWPFDRAGRRLLRRRRRPAVTIAVDEAEVVVEGPGRLVVDLDGEMLAVELLEPLVPADEAEAARGAMGALVAVGVEHVLAEADLEQRAIAGRIGHVLEHGSARAGLRPGTDVVASAENSCHQDLLLLVGTTGAGQEGSAAAIRAARS